MHIKSPKQVPSDIKCDDISFLHHPYAMPCHAHARIMTLIEHVFLGQARLRISKCDTKHIGCINKVDNAHFISDNRPICHGSFFSLHLISYHYFDRVLLFRRKLELQIPIESKQMCSQRMCFNILDNNKMFKHLSPKIIQYKLLMSL